jgi:hypothetical protein
LIIGFQFARPGIRPLVHDAGTLLIIAGLLIVTAALIARFIRGRGQK